MRSVVFIALVLLVGCKHTDSLQSQTTALTLESDSMAQRQTQMRRFETPSESSILLASAGVLQDLGFTIEESATKAGLIVASKDRDAVEAGQVASQIMLAAFIAALGGRADPVWETNQKIRISVATRPSGSDGTVVRVTFQRIIWNTKNQVSRVESINEAQIHQEFFNKLSQSIFLEAHEI